MIQNMDNGEAMSVLNTEISRLLPTTQSVSADAYSYNMLYVTKNGTNDAYAPAYPYKNDLDEIFDFNMSSCDKEEMGDNIYFQTTVYILYISIFVFALFGNGVVCYIVYRSPRMKTVHTYILCKYGMKL